MTTKAQEMLAADLTEKQLSDNIVSLARALGYLVHRDPTWRATGTDAGYPDLTLVRGGRIIFAELKAEKGKLTGTQGDWCNEIGLVQEAIAGFSGLAMIQGPDGWNQQVLDIVSRFVAYYCWRPSDWYAGRVEEALR